MTRLVATLGLVLVLSSCEDASPPPGSEVVDEPSIPLNEGPKVVFLGDSLSAGLHLDAEFAFPNVLQRRLSKNGAPFQLINAGISGDTTAGGLRRLPWLLSQSPDLVVVELGANDGLRGVTLESIESNLSDILYQSQQKGALVLLLGMRLPPNYGRDYSRGFDAIYPRLAGRFNISFIPFFMEGVAGNADLNLPDGIHPTEEGHERLADNIEEELTRIVRILNDKS